MNADLPQEWTALCLLVFALGLRHGFDADHLATIDGLTRYNARRHPSLARYCGSLFSLGHGAVVMAIALSVSALSHTLRVPAWLEGFGTLISMLFLAGLGLANLHAVLRAPAHEVVHPIGLKGRFLGRLTQTGRPGMVALIGALFALSFDTVSQAVLFALAATHFGGWSHALILGGLFMLGMLTSDGLNGLWISHLIQRADLAARVASRVLGLTLAGISLGMAALVLARWSLPSVELWLQGRELQLGAAVVVMIGASFLFAVRAARPTSPRATH